MCFMLFVHSGDDEFDDFPDTESPGEIILADHFHVTTFDYNYQNSFPFWFLI